MTLDHLREIALIQISQAQRTNAMTLRYTFEAESSRRVTVKAKDEHQARERAVDKLDKQVIADGKEPPVNHGLRMVRVC